MVQKEIPCPSCKKTMPIGCGFQHDEKLNFICSYCAAVVFAVTEEEERSVKSVIPTGIGSRKELLPIKIKEEPTESTPPENKDPETDQSDFEQYALFV